MNTIIADIRAKTMTMADTGLLVGVLIIEYSDGIFVDTLGRDSFCV